MEKTIQVTLDAELVETLQRTTAEQGVTLDKAVEEMARQYVMQARRKLIDQEFTEYKKMHPGLKEKYFGKHVAIYQGKLLDHDADAMTLVRRVRQQYGRVPILIVQVEEEPERELMIHSTRIATDYANTP